MKVSTMELQFCSLILLTVWTSVIAREILSYSDDNNSTRKEAGTPGSKVTGEWSWMDHNGKKRTIWYIADENGFRAFGDLVPTAETSEKQVNVPSMGSSIVPPMGSTKSDLAGVTEQPLDNKRTNIGGVSSNFTISFNINNTSSWEPSNSTSVNTTDNIEENFVDSDTHQLADDSNTITVETNPKIPKAIDKKDGVERRKIPGTSFTLLSSTKLPTQKFPIIPKENQIVPKPVENTGQVHPVITGILSAPRAIKVLDNKLGKILGPTNQEERKTPKPFKVEGMLNLDNFLRPAHIVNSGPRSRTPNPSELDYDYYYYDYYYDDARTETPILKTGRQSRKSSSRPRSTRSEEGSSESFEEFEDDDDSLEHIKGRVV